MRPSFGALNSFVTRHLDSLGNEEEIFYRQVEALAGQDAKLVLTSQKISKVKKNIDALDWVQEYIDFNLKTAEEIVGKWEKMLPDLEHEVLNEPVTDLNRHFIYQLFEEIIASFLEYTATLDELGVQLKGKCENPDCLRADLVNTQFETLESLRNHIQNLRNHLDSNNEILRNFANKWQTS